MPGFWEGDWRLRSFWGFLFLFVHSFSFLFDILAHWFRVMTDTCRRLFVLFWAVLTDTKCRKYPGSDDIGLGDMYWIYGLFIGKRGFSNHAESHVFSLLLPFLVISWMISLRAECCCPAKSGVNCKFGPFSTALIYRVVGSSRSLSYVVGSP